MIRVLLGIEDLAEMRFAWSPVHETVLSLRVLDDPGHYAVQLPWRRRALRLLEGDCDIGLLLSLVGPRHVIPDFLTPRSAGFAPTMDDQLAVVAQTPAGAVRADVRASHGRRLPAALRALGGTDDDVDALRDQVCAHLRRYWSQVIQPWWPRLRLVLEADMTYRARRLAQGGARLLFDDVHPNLTWDDGVLSIDRVIGDFDIDAAGRGLLLVPSAFSYKAAPQVSPDEPPQIVYPSRGTGTLWADPAPVGDGSPVAALLGSVKAHLLGLLEEPRTTTGLAGVLGVSPSAVSQHLRVLHAAGLLVRVRDGRRVLYRHSALGRDLLLGGRDGTG